MDLMTHLITLQQTVITLLQQSIGQTEVIFPNYSALISSSDSARTGAVSTLAQQFQRMAQAAPIPKNFPTPQTCRGKVEHKFSKEWFVWACDTCPAAWKTYWIRFVSIDCHLGDRARVIDYESLLSNHVSGQKSLECRICQMSIGDNQLAWRQHFWKHTFKDLEAGYNGRSLLGGWHESRPGRNGLI